MATAAETGLTIFWCVQREECGFMWLAALAGLSLAAKLEEVGMPSTISALQVCGSRLCWESINSSTTLSHQYLACISSAATPA